MQFRFQKDKTVYFPLLCEYLVSKTKMEHKRITGNKAGAAKDRAAVKAQVEAYADARQKEKARVS